MLLRKINAIVSLISTAMILFHSGILSVSMLSRGRLGKNETVMPYVLMGVMVIHAVISIVLAIRSHKDGGEGEQRAYPELNIPTMVQRGSGVIMLFMMGMHLAGSFNHFQPSMLHAVFHPLFFAVVLAHVAVSTSKAFVTLGIGNAKAIKVIDVIVKVLCAIILLASLVGFYLCLFMGVVA